MNIGLVKGRTLPLGVNEIKFSCALDAILNVKNALVKSKFYVTESAILIIVFIKLRCVWIEQKE